jgi:hypothetical protein
VTTIPTPTVKPTIKPTPTPSVLPEFTCQPIPTTTPPSDKDLMEYFFIGSLVDKIKGIHISWCAFVSFLDLILLLILAWALTKKKEENNIDKFKINASVQGIQIKPESNWKKFWKWLGLILLAIVLFPKKLWKKFQAWRLKRWAAKMSSISTLVAKEDQKDSNIV